MQHIPLEDREAFKSALGATLVKNNAHWRAFETVFEVYFSLRGPEYEIGDGRRATLDEMLARRCRSSCAAARARAAAAAMDALTPEELAADAATTR